MVELADFLDCCRVLRCIDAPDLFAADVIRSDNISGWVRFRMDPVDFILRADDATAARLWNVVESQRSSKATRGAHP